MSFSDIYFDRKNDEELEMAKKKKHVIVEEPVLTAKEPVVEEEKEPVGYIPWVGIVACEKDKLNVRKGPGVEFENLSECPTINKGEHVDVIGESGDWYNVKIKDDIYGFVMAKFISK